MNLRLALPDDDDAPEQVLDDKYLLVRRLGGGGMGQVFEAENLAIGRRVAVKLLNPTHEPHQASLERFEREARAAAHVGHPNIIEVLDMGRARAGRPYIVMELLEGEGLFARLEARGPMAPGHAVWVVRQVLAAIGAAHQAGIVHRDIKPENVFVARRRDGTEIVKVLDFGIAKFAAEEASRITAHGLIVGTPAYMSPEQARGVADLDARTDLYSAGAMLYELISGRLPHEGEAQEVLAALVTKDPPPLDELAPGTAPELVAIIQKAMARDRAERYQTAEELIEALAPFETIPEPPATVLRPSSVSMTATVSRVESWRSHRFWLAVAAVMAAAVLGAWIHRDEAEARTASLAAREPTPIAEVVNEEDLAATSGTQLDGALVVPPPRAEVVEPRSDAPPATVASPPRAKKARGPRLPFPRVY